MHRLAADIIAVAGEQMSKNTNVFRHSYAERIPMPVLIPIQIPCYPKTQPTR